MELCKLRFDGCHYLVQPYKRRYDFETIDIVGKTKAELIEEGYSFEQKKDLFSNPWAEINFPYESKGRTPIPKFYKPLYEELEKRYYEYLLEDPGNETDLKDQLRQAVFENERLDKLYHFLEKQNERHYINYINAYVERKKENLKLRKRRFKVKALNNDWNYFATFTYDDKKHTEESYVRSLKKKLQNLHTNYGWLYMGCFERSPKGRLHFHGLLYVPNGAMKGIIRQEEYYDVKGRKKAVSYINEEFEDKIGRNDFKAITKLDLTFTHALDYILKYIGKSNNKIVYSRGIKDDTFCLMDYEENVICKVSETSPYYVCADAYKIDLTKDLDLDFSRM